MAEFQPSIAGLFDTDKTYQKLPTLSTADFITNGDKILSRMYSYFERSSYKQSTCYDGHVASLNLLIHLYNDNLDKMREETISMLTKMYERFFTEVSIEVNFEQISDGRFLMIVTGTMNDNERVLRLDTKTDLGKYLTGFDSGVL